MKSTWVDGATPPSRDLVTHVLQRFTYGPTQQLLTDVRKTGVDNWFEKQLRPSFQSQNHPGGSVSFKVGHVQLRSQGHAFLMAYCRS
jgi:hypothetical protein